MYSILKARYLTVEESSRFSERFYRLVIFSIIVTVLSLGFLRPHGNYVFSNLQKEGY